jgi:hypothetical protein
MEDSSLAPGESPEGSILRHRVHRCGAVLLCLLAVVGGSCLSGTADLRQELLEFVEDIPDPPNSVLISQAEGITSGASTRCDGYIVSRLYGTDEPIDTVIDHMEDVCFELNESAVHQGVYPDGILVIRFPDDYLLGVWQVQLTPELIKDPFFMHKDVAIDQPYETVFQLNVVHGDPDELEYCKGIE